MEDRIPEAQAVEFTNYKDKNGFERSVTVRGDKFTGVHKALDLAIEQIMAEGGVPVVRGQKFAPKEKEYVPDRACPTCGKRLVYSTKKDGSKYIRCETNKWNAITQKAEGCSFVQWGTDEQEAKKYD